MSCQEPPHVTAQRRHFLPPFVFFIHVTGVWRDNHCSCIPPLLHSLHHTTKPPPAYFHFPSSLACLLLFFFLPQHFGFTGLDTCWKTSQIIFLPCRRRQVSFSGPYLLLSSKLFRMCLYLGLKKKLSLHILMWCLFFSSKYHLAMLFSSFIIQCNFNCLKQK